MNTLYAKTLLYAYPSIDDLIIQLDEVIKKKALGSMTDCSPAEEQCIKVVQLLMVKGLFFHLKKTLNNVLETFSDEDYLYFDYKYFKSNPKSFYVDFDSVSRSYFRKQIKLLEKFCKKIEEQGITDEWFKSECMTLEFFKNLYRHTCEREALIVKAKNVQKKKVEKSENKVENELNKSA